jgi:hypothetical protein
MSSNNLNSNGRAVTAALALVLDEITRDARAAHPGGRISARLIGRVLAYRIGVRPWEGQRLAKAYVMQPHTLVGGSRCCVAAAPGWTAGRRGVIDPHRCVHRAAKRHATGLGRARPEAAGDRARARALITGE